MRLINFHFYNPKNYLYSKPVKGLHGFGVRYGFGFNGKEMDSEELGGGGSTYDYGFRIYNAQLGKFLSVDPLTKEYPWNSTYAYAENDVIRSIDLDGLEKVVVILEQHPEKREFDANANYLETQGYTVLRASTGAEIIKSLEQYTIDGGKPIENLVILSHASSGGLYGLNGNDNGLYLQTTLDDMVSYRAERDNVSPEELENTYRQQGAATICDLETSIKQDKIVFADGATILFGGCNAGSTQNDGSSGIAEVTAQELLITTVGADGSTWDLGKFPMPNDKNMSGNCSTRSCREADFGWNKFEPNGSGGVNKTELSSGGTGWNPKDRKLSNGRTQNIDLSENNGD